MEHSHGLTADGKTVASYFEQGDGPEPQGGGLNRRFDYFPGRGLSFFFPLPRGPTSLLPWPPRGRSALGS